MPKILILNGPNLNLLGTREPEIYGRDTLSDIEHKCRLHGQAIGCEIDFQQSNSEGEIVDWIQLAQQESDGIIYKPRSLYAHICCYYGCIKAVQKTDCRNTYFQHFQSGAVPASFLYIAGGERDYLRIWGARIFHCVGCNFSTSFK